MIGENLTIIVQIIAAITMLLGVAGVILNRQKVKRGLGVRSIQFTAVILVIPTILILSLEEVISGEIVGTLLGALIGYLLSSISNYDKSEKDKK